MSSAEFVSMHHPDVRLPDEERRCVETELHAILSSPFFRLSRRSCEFLLYLVQHGLNGQSDYLKERAIGIHLLGRKPSYDTGSDAAVRVRANDVRRRLASYYEKIPPASGYRIDLAAGSYVPRFVPIPRPLPVVVASGAVAAPEPLHRTRLSPPKLRLLVIATLVVLWSGTLLFRREMLAATPFDVFWRDLFRGKPTMALVPNPGAAGGGPGVTLTELDASLPLISVAEAFHVQPAIRDASVSAKMPAGVAQIRVVIAGPNTSSDSKARGSWVRLSPGNVPTLSIEAADADALRSAIRTLADRERFPSELAGLLRTRQGGSVFIAAGQAR